MDRNSVIGLLLIAAILFGYSLLTAPSEKEQYQTFIQKGDQAFQEEAYHKARKAYQKALELFPKKEHPKDRLDRIATLLAKGREKVENKGKKDSVPKQEKATPSKGQGKPDSLRDQKAKKGSGDTAKKAPKKTAAKEGKPSPDSAQLRKAFGIFAPAAKKRKEKTYTIQNERIKVRLSSQGGRIISVELKNYQTNDSLPLRLFHKDSSSYGLEFSYRNRILKTDSLHFKAIGSSFEVRGQEADSIRLRTPTTEDGRFIEFVYKLKGSSYQVDHKVHIKGLDREMNEDPTLHWSYKNLSTEKSMSGQQRISTVCYKYQGGESSYLTQQGKGSIKNLVTTVEWVSFKQRFFSSILISDRGFGTYNANLQVEDLNSERYVSHYKANLTLPFDNAGNKSFPMSFFFGPNKYELLASYERNFEGTMNLGWGIIGWINEYLIIPIFGMLDESGLNYGIVILILTLIIKTILFPLTYKSFLSGAKQRVLKPEIDALQEKYKGSDDQMKQQQEMMALYKKSGVNPMAGCLPMFIQLPILIAMYRFFPTSIELRQEPFLWASDLSSYDSILSLPFNIPFYGDHVSLFTLLMFASTMIYTKLSSSQMGGGGNQQMPQMKVMMYIFPIFILFIFNSWPAGLSYYYFTANVISICQMLIVKHWIIDEDELKRKIEENKKKPQKEKKASKFQKRLEDMAKQKGYKPPNK